MAIISVKNLLEAGVHFGHRVSRWNPKMAPYIFAKRNFIHIINLRETVKGLIRAYYFLRKLTTEGHEILLVGTKRQAKTVIKKESLRCNMHYVAERWLGGTLTNYETIRKRLSRLEELENMENDGRMESLSKKMASALRRERRKIHRNLEGIRNMERLPGAIIIVDPQKEHIAIKEAVKLNIPTICLMDTDSDPDLVDIPIPGNDDAMRSIEVIITKLIDAIIEGRAEWEEKQRIEKKKREESEALKPASRAEKYGEEGPGGKPDARRGAPRGDRGGSGRGRSSRGRRDGRRRRPGGDSDRPEERRPTDENQPRQDEGTRRQDNAVRDNVKPGEQHSSQSSPQDVPQQKQQTQASPNVPQQKQQTPASPNGNASEQS